jgi:outer membrane protein assembly factor BamD
LLHRLRAPLATALLAVLVVGCGASVVPQIMNDSSRVPLARKLYDKGDYSMAADVLTGYAQAGTGNADIDQAIYLLGLTRLKQHDWASAQGSFERVLRDYPESDSAASASYRLAEAFFGQSRPSDFDQEFTLRALTQWEQFVKGSPDHAFVPSANAQIAVCRTRLARKLWRSGDVYFKQSYYEPARRYFQSVIDEYSDTPVYGDAVIGLAMTNARMGMKDSALAMLRGLETEFAGKPLGEAAAQVRRKVEGWPAEGDRRRRRNRAIEPVTPPQLPTAPSTAGGISGTP